MLDENLPTFFIKHSSEHPLSSVVYFTQNGSEPAPEYTFKKPDPALPLSKNKFAVGLGDACSQDVIFGEVLVEPEWQQPTLSAAEIRAQNGATPPLLPLIPDGFTIQLYNPDQQIPVKGEKSTWTGKESWEFEMPQQSFRMPSSSQLDRQQNDPAASDIAPKIMFRWKRDSKFTKDMTCYMCGKSLGGKKSKEPDITIAMYKQGKEPAVTIYEPNLQRVEVEDRKGLEVTILLSADVIRELYLFPSRESFNIDGLASNTKRKNSRPIPGGASPPKLQTPPAHANTMSGAFTMSGAMSNTAPPPPRVSSPGAQQSARPPNARSQWEIDAETKRLQALTQQEQREREKHEKAEQKRIKRMLEEEERERKRREAEVNKETERLRKQFGLQGQDYPPRHPSLPPRPAASAGPSNSAHPTTLQPVQPPPRPVSAGPSNRFSSWWQGPAMSPGVIPPGYMPPPQQPPSMPPRRRSAEAQNKLPKKRSVFF
jgi:hypothetical protein